jgi:hypothetical protein
MIASIQFSLMDYMMSISGSLILLLLGTIGYFLKQFAISVKDLKATVDNLTVILSVEQERVKNTANNIEVLTDRVNIIATKVDSIDKDVAILIATNNITNKSTK